MTPAILGLIFILICAAVKCYEVWSDATDAEEEAKKRFYSPYFRFSNSD